jgi:hypothetical protein
VVPRAIRLLAGESRPVSASGKAVRSSYTHVALGVLLLKSGQEGALPGSTVPLSWSGRFENFGGPLAPGDTDSWVAWGFL